MRIDRLRIQNFRRFKLVDLELADGVTALIGRNGAGKSTLLESIGWCLYGNEAARTGKDLIKRRGAAPHEDVRVHLAFRFGAHEYEITRELVGKSEAHTATVKVDGMIAVPAGAASAREATAYVERLFHMERDAFFRSVVARQRELAALTDAKPAERKKILIGLLRLDPVDVAIAEARAQRRDVRAQLAGLRSAMLDQAALLVQHEAARKAVGAQTVAIGEVEVRIARLVDELEDVRVRRDSSRKVADEHKTILFDLNALDERLTVVRADRARRTAETERARAAAVEAAALAPQLEALPAARLRVEHLAARAIQHQELVRIQAEVARADADALRATSDLAQARAALAAAAPTRAIAERVAADRPVREQAVVTLQKKVSDLEAQAREIAKRLNDLSQKDKRIRTLGPEAPCPTCTRPLHEHYGELLHDFATDTDAFRATLAEGAPLLDAARKEEAAARTALTELASQDAALRGTLLKLAAEEERAAAGSARLTDAQARAARMREQAAALAGPPFDPREVEAARTELRALEVARERHARLIVEAEREKEIAPLLVELATAEDAAARKRAETLARRAALEFDPAAHDALERATQACETRLQGSRIERERAVGERVRKEDEEKRIAATLAQQGELMARAALLEKQAVLLEELAGERDGGLLPEFKDHLITRIRPLLTLHAGRLFRELTEGRYADLEVDESYDLLVHDEGKPFPLARFSGGEADLANLCLRLAVSQVVAERAGSAGIGLLALDEIFGSQDEARKSNILRALASLSGRFRQILLITHISDVKESAEHVLRVESLDDGTSRVVVEA